MNTSFVISSSSSLLLFTISFYFMSHFSGHNWGAEHDPETFMCTPSSLFDGGKYLMYAYSVSGYDSNNNVSSATGIVICLMFGRKNVENIHLGLFYNLFFSFFF